MPSHARQGLSQRTCGSGASGEASKSQSTPPQPSPLLRKREGVVVPSHARHGRYRYSLSRALPGTTVQCADERENRLITSTPAQIRPMPTMAAASSFCLNTNKPIREISTMPTPDQIA